MKIDGVRPSNIAPARGRGSLDADAAFAPHVGAGPIETAPSRAVAALGGLSAVLALQVDPPSRRRRQISRGAATLDALDALVLATLEGEDPQRALAGMRAALAEREETSDPELDSLLQEIDVRASVELAKRERALSSSPLGNRR